MQRLINGVLLLRSRNIVDAQRSLLLCGEGLRFGGFAGCFGFLQTSILPLRTGVDAGIGRGRTEEKRTQLHFLAEYGACPVR